MLKVEKEVRIDRLRLKMKEPVISVKINGLNLINLTPASVFAWPRLFRAISKYTNDWFARRLLQILPRGADRCRSRWSTRFLYILTAIIVQALFRKRRCPHIA